MSGPEPEWLLVSWLRLVQARWMVTGVPRRDREDLLQQLLRDLATARAAGARIEELVATPPAVFADSCTAGLRSRYGSISTVGLLIVCLGTGIASTGAAWLLLLTFSHFAAAPPGFDEGTFYLLIDLALIAAVLAVMVAVPRWKYRRHAETATLTPRLAIALTGATVVGFPLASLYGSSQAYSLNPTVIASEVLIVLSFLALATITAQRWNRIRPKADVRGAGSATT